MIDAMMMNLKVLVLYQGLMTVMSNHKFVAMCLFCEMDEKLQVGCKLVNYDQAMRLAR